MLMPEPSCHSSKCGRKNTVTLHDNDRRETVIYYLCSFALWLVVCVVVVVINKLVFRVACIKCNKNCTVKTARMWTTKTFLTKTKRGNILKVRLCLREYNLNY